MVRYESLGTISYSHSRATIVVSLAIFEIFVIRNVVRGRSRSLKMAQFDRPHNDFLVCHSNYKSRPMLYHFQVI